jgi:WD40 repeat protein
MNPALYENTGSRQGHEGAVLCALYCAEMACFITSGDDGTIRLWPEGEEPKPANGVDSVREAVVLSEHKDRVTGLVAVGKTLVSVSWDLTLRVWNLEFVFEDRGVGLRCESTHVIHNAHDDYMLSVAYSPELRQIASSSADQGVKMWNMDQNTPASREEEAGTEAMYVPEGKRGKRCCGVLLGHTADVTTVLWNAKHSMWVTSSEDRTARLWDVHGVQLGEVIPPGDSITALAIDLTYGHVLIATMDKSLRTYVVEPDTSTETQWPWQLTQVRRPSFPSQLQPSAPPLVLTPSPPPLL